MVFFIIIAHPPKKKEHGFIVPFEFIYKHCLIIFV